MFTDPAFYVLIAFILFLFVAGKPILKFAQQHLDGCIDEIVSKLQEASAHRDAAQARLNEMKLKFHEANKLAIKIQEQSIEISESWKKKAEADLEFLLLKRKNLLDQRIDILFRHANNDMKFQLSSLITSYLKSFLSLSKKDFRQVDIITKASHHRF